MSLEIVLFPLPCSPGPAVVADPVLPRPQGFDVPVLSR